MSNTLHMSEHQCTVGCYLAIVAVKNDCNVNFYKNIISGHYNGWPLAIFRAKCGYGCPKIALCRHFGGHIID